MGAPSSSLGQSTKVNFNLDLVLSEEIFNYRYTLPPPIENSIPPEEDAPPVD